MGWPMKLLFMSLLGLAACQQRSINGGSRRQRVPAGKSEVANFNCPEDFGYYPHPSDCTQYYVCVFGGALQESCTGGLVYSHELQTCDWPRNVVCNLSPAGSGVSTVRITDPRTQNTNSVRSATEPLTPSVGSFDVRFQNSLSSQSPRDSQSFSVFDGSDKNRQPKFLRQESDPQQSFTRFPQQSFFSDTDVQESSSRPINVHPTTNRSPVFPWWKLQSLGQGDLQSLEEKARPVRATSLAQFYRSGRDVTHLNDSTPDFDFGLPFVSAATPRFGQESQPHILSRRQQHQPKTFGAAPSSFRNPKPRAPNPRPDQGISRRQSRPKNNFFNQGFPPNHFQSQQFSRFPPNPFSNSFHSQFPPQSSPANPFGNFQTFSHFSDDLDTRPFTLNHKPIGQHHSQQHGFPPRHPLNTTPRPDFSHFDENLQVGHFSTRPQGQLHVFPPRLPHSNFAPRPQNDPFSTHLSHPRFPPSGTPVEPFVIEEALAHTSPQPPLRVTPLDYSTSDLRPPPPPPQNLAPSFPHEFPSHSQFPKVDDSEFHPHSKFSNDDVPVFPPHSQFPNVDEPEYPPHSQFPNVHAPEFPPHSQFSNVDDPEFPSHSQFSNVDDPEFPPRSKFPISNHFSESQFPTHPAPPPPPPSPSPAPPTTNPPPEPENLPSRPPSVPEFSPTSRTPFATTATTEFSFIPEVNGHPIPRTTVSPNPSFNTITEKPHRLSTHVKPTAPFKPPSPSTFPPFSNVRPTFSSFQNPSPSKSQSEVKTPGTPPQIPGTARHPELSKLSASNSQTLDSKSPSSTLSQDNRQPFRPQTSFSAAVTSRPVARPAPTRAPVVEDAFYSDYNLTDADYLYYYDDLLYDYYDLTPTTTKAPVRRPAVTSAPARQPTASNRGTAAPSRAPQRTNPAATTGPISVDASVPKRNSRPTLKPVSVVAPTTSAAIDIWKYPPQRPSPTRPQPPVDAKATKCDPKVCRLPDCYCGGKDVPGGIHPQDTPQMVLLTFDDSVNDLNKGLYTELFENGRKNPNGCPIVSTMYVSHEWTDYSQVQNLYADGHEMASHSIQHSFGEQFSIKKWAKEIAGQREILAAYGGVRMEDVRGMRAPFLAVGGNKMFKMLYDQNFTYDSSMPVYENKPPSWPYTLDYKIFHDCMIPPCPTNSYPGVWEVPMVMWQDLNGGRCSMGDACTTPPDAEGVYKMLIKNFERHYTSNRAPFGLFYHAAWFTTPHHKEGFIAFLDTITAMDDVWLITNHQLLQWMRDPQPLSTIKNFAPFGCSFPDRKKCTSTKVCNVWHKGGVRYMRTCQQCPEKYPWTGNTGVRSPLNDV
ncbi:mucin-2-like isoform X11 [Macrobrachium nipponense]|uniref:mucin-2-like isoform X11 n=1 Tax=Macrobrachium nipponense TaxID=159736 RepID=UPI0030C7D9B3